MGQWKVLIGTETLKPSRKFQTSAPLFPPAFTFLYALSYYVICQHLCREYQRSGIGTWACKDLTVYLCSSPFSHLSLPVFLVTCTNSPLSWARPILWIWIGRTWKNTSGHQQSSKALLHARAWSGLPLWPVSTGLSLSNHWVEPGGGGEGEDGGWKGWPGTS